MDGSDAAAPPSRQRSKGQDRLGYEGGVSMLLSPGDTNTDLTHTHAKVSCAFILYFSLCQSC